ncbi:hypothetical protein [Thermocrinis sp.]|uniref:hypothetical protein n=1 Tax=Thermocrinis sp. TaxID=2024383 RepID=UPI003C0D9F59
MKRLLILVSSLYLFSCATKPQVQVIEKEVIVKCPVPNVPKTERPVIKPDQPYTEKLQSLLNYMFRLERENEILREVIDTCKE